MNRIPLKVAIVAGLELGFTVGFGLFTYYTLRAIGAITANKNWQGFRAL